MNHITVLNRNIQKSDGLYSLNDLHKAAGNENKHRPSIFIANQQTVELIKEISKAGIPALQTYKGNRSDGLRGTYACKELVIAYGAWINPEIHLAVIQTFLASGQQHEQIQLMQDAMIQLQQQQSQILDMLKNSNQLTLAQKPDIRLNARLTAAQEQEIMELVHQGYCKTDIAKQYNISRTTVYRVLRSHTH